MSDETSLEQRSVEWQTARLGRATASRFKDVLATISKGEAAARRNYRAELVSERLTGVPFERYSTAKMDWGTNTEDLAKLEYRFATGNTLQDTGFWKHPTLECGASPDSLIGKDGILEVKNPELGNHIEMLKTNEIPSQYVPQTQGQLLMTDRSWGHFISYAGELPENARLMIVRFVRDDKYIEMLESELKKFLEEVEQEVEFVKNYKRETNQ